VAEVAARQLQSSPNFSGGEDMASKAPVYDPASSPAQFFDAMNAYQQTAALRTAIELDLFTAISEGAHTAPEIARRCQATERGTRILCDFLAITGFLVKEGKRYTLTADSATFLVRGAPAYLGDATRFLCAPELVHKFDGLADIVRHGQTDDGIIKQENPLWVEFARAMGAFTAMPAELIAAKLGASQGQRWKVLDIAAGHGLFGITLTRHNPNAQVVAQDWPGVLQVAKENAEKAGVSARYSTLPGSAFDVEFGSGYDVVLLTNFLHHFNPPTCESLLRKVHGALSPAGRVATLEFVPNEDRVSPPTPAKFAMIMLGETPEGDAYPFAELRTMFQNAGFSRSELHDLSPSPQNLIISYK
jgi:2-polyprenyl-3-methyl-5-hydroxy-6-metoxy-1,4-benzoquinol methylase